MDIRPSDALVEAGSGSPVQSAVSGLASSLQNYLGGQLKAQQDVSTYSQESDIEANKEIKIAQAKHAIDNPSGGQNFIPMDPQLAEKALPGYGAKMVQEYNQRNPNNPLSLNDASDYISKAQTMIDAANPKQDDKYLASQDRLEKQAQDRITQVRGDQSLLKTETQRDAAAMAYETIVKAQSEGRHLSSLEYNDLAAQLWRARTGTSTTTEELKKIAPSTAQSSSDHLAAWASGNPNLIGATSTDTENNLKQFVISSGQMADKQHDAYMGPRLVKPTDLEQGRWDRIAAQSRGLAFGEQKKVSDTTHATKAPETPLIHTYPSGRKAKYNTETKQWEPFNG